MIRRILVTALAGVTLLLAADPTGTWTGDQPGRDGNTYNITFKLKAEGTKLTGTMGGEQFEQPIQNGEVHGDDISFTVHLEFGGGIDLSTPAKWRWTKSISKCSEAVMIRHNHSLPRKPNKLLRVHAVQDHAVQDHAAWPCRAAAHCRRCSKSRPRAWTLPIWPHNGSAPRRNGASKTRGGGVTPWSRGHRSSATRGDRHPPGESYGRDRESPGPHRSGARGRVETPARIP